MTVLRVEVDPNKLLDTTTNFVYEASPNNGIVPVIQQTHYYMTPFEQYNTDAANVFCRTENYFDDGDFSLLTKCSWQKEITYEEGNNSSEVLLSKFVVADFNTDELRYYESNDDLQQTSVCMANFTVNRWMIADNDDFQHYFDVCAYKSTTQSNASSRCYYTVVSLKIFNADSELWKDYKQRMAIARAGAPLIPAPSKLMHFLERERQDLYDIVKQQFPQHVRPTNDTAVSAEDPTDSFDDLPIDTKCSSREWLTSVVYGRLASLVEYRINDRAISEMSFEELQKTLTRACVLAEPDYDTRVSLIVLYERINMSNLDLNVYYEDELLSQRTPQLMTEMSIPKLLSLAGCVTDEELREDIEDRIVSYMELCSIATREVSRTFTKFNKSA